MHICADTDKLKALLSLLREEQRQAKRLREMCRDYYVAAQADPMADASFYQNQERFFEEQEESIYRRIELLENVSEKLIRLAEKTEENLEESLRQMYAVSEDIYL